MSTTAPTTRRRHPTVVLALAAVMSALVGCSIQEALPPPDCRSGGSGIIAAQSVPTASFVPCLEPLPDGWEVASVWVDHRGTSIHFDSDRAGGDAAILHLDAACDLGDAIPAATDQSGAERHDDIERLEPGFRARRLYVFEGGCVWWQFDFDEGAPSALSIELGNQLVLVSRETLNDNIRETFLDEEL